jgi:hypothetical protein
MKPVVLWSLTGVAAAAILLVGRNSAQQAQASTPGGQTTSPDQGGGLELPTGTTATPPARVPASRFAPPGPLSPAMQAVVLTLLDPGVDASADLLESTATTIAGADGKQNAGLVQELRHKAVAARLLAAQRARDAAARRTPAGSPANAPAPPGLEVRGQALALLDPRVTAPASLLSGLADILGGPGAPAENADLVPRLRAKAAQSTG